MVEQLVESLTTHDSLRLIMAQKFVIVKIELLKEKLLNRDLKTTATATGTPQKQLV